MKKFYCLLIVFALFSLPSFATDERTYIDWHQSRHPGKSVISITFHQKTYDFLVEDAAVHDTDFVDALVDQVFKLDAEE